ncbi:hypothetical protein ACTFIV_006542 [Dictyostelium citrinum]
MISLILVTKTSLYSYYHHTIIKKKQLLTPLIHIYFINNNLHPYIFAISVINIVIIPSPPSPPPDSSRTSTTKSTSTIITMAIEIISITRTILPIASSHNTNYTTSIVMNDNYQLLV